MKESEFVKGMKVRISTNLSKTRNRYSLTKTMSSMRGSVYKLEGLTHLKKGGFIRKLDRRYTFDLRDLSPITTETLPIKAVTFDPSQLDV